MSKNAELSRKDMKEPDKFQVAANQAASWIAARKKAAVPVARLSTYSPDERRPLSSAWRK